MTKERTHPANRRVVRRPALTATLLGIVLLLLGRPAGAAINEWTLRGPYRAWVEALAIDPWNPSTLYAGTWGAGVYKSIDGGDSWAAAGTGLPGETWISDLAIDSWRPFTLYAAASDAGVYKSVDGGNSWSEASHGLTIEGLGFDLDVRALAIDPTSPSTLYAGTWSGGVFKSVDGGNSWSEANAGLISDGRRASVHVLAIDPANPSTLYAGSWGDGVYKSVDGGTSWTAINAGLPLDAGQADYLDVRALVIDPGGPGRPVTLYAGLDHDPWAGGNGLYRSVGGTSWTEIAAGLGACTFYKLTIATGNPPALYAGTSCGAYRSVDGGDSWTAINNGMRDRFVHDLAIDPANPSTLYAGTSGDGLYRSVDGGDSWTKTNSGLIADGSPITTYELAIDSSSSPALYAATAEGVYRSDDGGTSWTAGVGIGPDNTSAVGALAIDPRNPSILYAGAGSLGVYKSVDGGLTWTITALTSGDQTSELAIDPRSSAVYAGTRAGIFKSVDGGVSWTVGVGLPDDYWAEALAIDPRNPATVYAGSYVDGVYKSIDGGASWTATGLSDVDVHDLAIDPQSAALFAGAEDGVYRSVDGGISWSAARNGLPRERVYALAIDSGDSTVYAAIAFGGVYRSADGGISWTLVRTGPPSSPIASLVIDPGRPTILYAATPTGVFGLTRIDCADPAILCLNRERFLVELEWRDFAGGSGSGQVVPYRSDDSAVFWFFAPDNWEMLLKVLDGCRVNDRFWVFAAATTNVEYTLRVTDTATGLEKSYFNPLGQAAAALTDTNAFATCGEW